jgi:aldose 1-epimerase
MARTETFGRIDGQGVEALTIEGGGLRARVITWGARLVELWTPDREGRLEDVVLGFDTLEEYLATDHYFGATCGRYGNRIAGGRFRLDGAEVEVDRNEAGNHLHGGREGFDRKIWEVEEAGPSRVRLRAASADGEMGFPGACALWTTYELTGAGELLVTMEATTTRPTVMNMVHHGYFNLAGQGSGDVLGQELRLPAPFYTPVDAELLATGEVRSVAGTPFDFREAKPIGRDIGQLPGVAVGGLEGGGYDHNWCLEGAGVPLREAAELRDPASGRRLRLSTTERGVQVYTGGYLTDRVAAKRGRRMCRFAGLTFETQAFPGTPNHAHFPPAVLRPGEAYRHRMVFAFDAA